MAMLCFVFCVNIFSVVFIFYLLCFGFRLVCCFLFFYYLLCFGFRLVCWREKEGDVK
jgi:hypothetical protein